MWRYLPAGVFGLFAILFFIVAASGDEGDAMPPTIFIIPAVFFVLLSAVSAVIAWVF